MLSRHRAAIFSIVAIAGDMLRFAAMMSSVIDFLENFRIETEAPSIANGGMMMLTRLPSGRRASTSGRDSSMRRPIRVTILVQMFIKCGLSRKITSVSSSLPRRST